MGVCLEAFKLTVKSQVLYGNSRRVRYENSLSVLDPRCQKALDSLTDIKCLDQKESFFYVCVHDSSLGS